MRVLIAGGTGFLGSALRRALSNAGHEVRILTRGSAVDPETIHWDGTSVGKWADALSRCDAVVNACGYGLEHWPWSQSTKRRFYLSRTEPAHALTQALTRAERRPAVFVQFSGINRYGLTGTEAADEETPAASDFLAQLTVDWEAASAGVERLGVRRVIVRHAVVLGARGGLFPLMSLPAKIFVGGPLGTGAQALPWIHLEDQVRAILYLLEDDRSTGAYNLVSPEIVTNAKFMRETCAALHRPYWLKVPEFAMRLVLGEMSVLVLRGRPSRPRRLIEAGFEFRFPRIGEALANLVGGHARPL